MESWKEELYHHGILGMKWGVRNGPPYPLDTSQYSGKEKKLAEYANKEVKKQMKAETDRYVDYVRKKEGIPENQSLIEQFRRRIEIAKEFENSPEYRDLMHMRYAEILDKGNDTIERGKRNTAIAVGVIGGAAVVAGVVKYKFRQDAKVQGKKIMADAWNKERDRKWAMKMASKPRIGPDKKGGS